MNWRQRQVVVKRIKYHADPAERERVLARNRAYRLMHKAKPSSKITKVEVKAKEMLKRWFPAHFLAYSQLRRQQVIAWRVMPASRPITASEYVLSNNLKVTNEMRSTAWGLELGHRKLIGGKVRHIYERQLAPVLDRICLACPKSDCTADNSYLDCDVVMASPEVQKLNKVVTIDAKMAHRIAWLNKFRAIDSAEHRMRRMRLDGYEHKGTKESFIELLAYLASRSPLFFVKGRKEDRAALDRMRRNYPRERLNYYREREEQTRALVAMIPRFRRTELYRLSLVMLKMICLREIRARIITPEEFVARENLVSPIADREAWKARHHWRFQNAALRKERSFAAGGSGK